MSKFQPLIKIITSENDYRQTLDRIQGIKEHIKKLRQEKTHYTDLMVSYMNSPQYRKDRPPGDDDHIAACQNQEWKTNQSQGSPRLQSSPGSLEDPPKLQGRGECSPDQIKETF